MTAKVPTLIWGVGTSGGPATGDVVIDGVGRREAPITVIRDPEGLVDPRLPEELAEAVETAPVTIPLTVVVVAGLCAGAAWSRDREERATGR